MVPHPWCCRHRCGGLTRAARDPEFADVHRGIQHAHAAPLREVLARAADRGELPATAAPSTMTAGLLGPLFYRRWFSRQPFDDQFLTTVAAVVLGGQEATHDPGSRPAGDT